MEKRLFNIIDELAVYIAVPREAIYDWISQKKLPYIKIGRSVKFDKEDIVRFIDGKKYDGIGRELDSSKNFFVKFLCFNIKNIRCRWRISRALIGQVGCLADKCLFYL